MLISGDKSVLQALERYETGDRGALEALVRSGAFSRKSRPSVDLLEGLELDDMNLGSFGGSIDLNAVGDELSPLTMEEIVADPLTFIASPSTNDGSSRRGSFAHADLALGLGDAAFLGDLLPPTPGGLEPDFGEMSPLGPSRRRSRSQSLSLVEGPRVRIKLSHPLSPDPMGGAPPPSQPLRIIRTTTPAPTPTGAKATPLKMRLPSSARVITLPARDGRAAQRLIAVPASAVKDGQLTPEKKIKMHRNERKNVNVLASVGGKTQMVRALTAPPAGAKVRRMATPLLSCADGAIAFPAGTVLQGRPVTMAREDGAQRRFVGAYSPESRKKRIARFLEKRKRRIWQKKVKYDVRKSFADSRMRIKGRFVKKEDEAFLKKSSVDDA